MHVRNVCMNPGLGEKLNFPNLTMCEAETSNTAVHEPEPEPKPVDQDILYTLKLRSECGAIQIRFGELPVVRIDEGREMKIFGIGGPMEFAPSLGIQFEPRREGQQEKMMGSPIIGGYGADSRKLKH